MVNFLANNFGTILILGVLLVLAALAVRSIIVRKKSADCSCGCSSCSYSDKCH